MRQGEPPLVLGQVPRKIDSWHAWACRRSSVLVSFATAAPFPLVTGVVRQLGVRRGAGTGRGMRRPASGHRTVGPPHENRVSRGSGLPARASRAARSRQATSAASKEGVTRLVVRARTSRRQTACTGVSSRATWTRTPVVPRWFAGCGRPSSGRHADRRTPAPPAPATSPPPAVHRSS